MSNDVRPFCMSAKCDIRYTPKGVMKEGHKDGFCIDCGHAVFFFPANRRTKNFVSRRPEGSKNLAARDKLC